MIDAVNRWIKQAMSRDERIMRIGVLLQVDRIVDEHGRVAIDEGLHDAVLVGQEPNRCLHQVIGLGSV